MNELQSRLTANKIKLMDNLEKTIKELQSTPEGISPLLAESLETTLKILPNEHVYNAGNDWEVK